MDDILVFRTGVLGTWREKYAGIAAFARTADWRLQPVDARSVRPDVRRLLSFWKPRGAIVDKTSGACIWWLRSPGFDASTATRVLLDGRINYCGYRVHSKRQAVRPFVWVTFDPNNTTMEG